MYIVYKTVNSVNGKIYVGVHKQKGSDFDGYLGSGTRLLTSIKSYGSEKFFRITIAEFDDRNEAYSMERRIVNFEFIQSEFTYNMIEGGKGGGAKLMNEVRLHKLRTDPEFKKRFSQAVSQGQKKTYLSGNRKRPKKVPRPPLSEDHKRKIGIANSKNQKGIQNSQFGTMWITDGVSNKKIKKGENIPEGFIPGRVPPKQNGSVAQMVEH